MSFHVSPEPILAQKPDSDQFVSICIHMSYNTYMASTIADKIRAFAREKYIRPAKARGEQRVTILAGDLVRELGLDNRTPAVCCALRSLIFQRENGIELASADG